MRTVLILKHSFTLVISVQHAASICDALKEPPFDTKQKILRLVVDRILVEDDRLVIKHIVPAVPFRLRPDSPNSILLSMKP
jgi:hypothetical protein